MDVTMYFIYSWQEWMKQFHKELYVALEDTETYDEFCSAEVNKKIFPVEKVCKRM